MESCFAYWRFHQHALAGISALNFPEVRPGPARQHFLIIFFSVWIVVQQLLQLADSRPPRSRIYVFLEMQCFAFLCCITESLQMFAVQSHKSSQHPSAVNHHFLCSRLKSNQRICLSVIKINCSHFGLICAKKRQQLRRRNRKSVSFRNALSCSR